MTIWIKLLKIGREQRRYLGSGALVDVMKVEKRIVKNK